MLRSRSLVGLLLVALALGACSDGEGLSSWARDGEFESANPGAKVDQQPGGSDAVAPSGDDGNSLPVPPDAPGNDDGAGRAIEEADIVRIQEGKLYALSRYGGLSVVDISRRDRLSLLGHHKVVATPLDMYVRDGVVLALYRDFREETYDAERNAWLYHETSQLIAIDARDPGAMTEIGRFTIPGEITDSRIVGDILYVAAFQNGRCWGCEKRQPRTAVLSLNVSDPAAITKIDEIGVRDRQGGGAWRRALATTDRRLYLAGPSWEKESVSALGSTIQVIESQPNGSIIQVIDISDPTGDMREGASVTVSGRIDSRWQMDEYDGVLRVISQPLRTVGSPPKVETFAIESSDTITHLAATSLALPRPERLQSVRFDGTRAYAVTFERTDPLFTIDLRDPAAPRQMGELEMPGWLYHMEPRGERLFGVGYEPGNPKGGVTVSLFDVADLSRPVMLSRVNFGDDWSQLAENQNQIHKAFTVLDDAGLILVPFSDYRTPGDPCRSAEYRSGVQLIDFTDDTLRLRGIAHAQGPARRGFVHDGRLFTMSDERVESFDVTDRDAPVSTASQPLAQFVGYAQGTGDRVIRIGRGWYSRAPELDVTTLAGAGTPSARGRLEIPQLGRESCNESAWLDAVHSDDDAAYLLYTRYERDPLRNRTTASSHLLSIDVADPSAPVVAADTKLDFYPSYPSYHVSAAPCGAHTVNRGSILAMVSREYAFIAERPLVTRSELKLLDLSAGAAREVATVRLPPALGATGLLLSGDVVATSQFQPTTKDFRRGRFYLERVDISNPRLPVRAPSVNIPGSLLFFDAARSRAITVDYRELVLDDVTPSVCIKKYLSYDFTRADDPFLNYERELVQCRAIVQILRLVQVDGDRARILASHELGLGERVDGTATGTDRLFIALRGYPGYFEAPSSAYDYGRLVSGKVPLLTVGFDADELEVGRIELDTGDHWVGYTPIVASGHRAAVSLGFLGKLTIVDASDPSAPSVVREAKIPGNVVSLTLLGDTALASLGYDGVAAVPLMPAMSGAGGRLPRTDAGLLRSNAAM